MKKKKVYNLTSKSFAKIFGTDQKSLSPHTNKAIKKANFKYQIVDGKDYEDAILQTIKILDSKTLKVSGPHRKDDWEKGWRENLQEFNQGKQNLNLLIPKFVKNLPVRFQGNLINPESSSFETDFVTVIRYYLFSKYYKKINSLYEFGAGTGLNLVAASEVFPHMKLIGLDWANSSVEIINALKRRQKINITGRRFDLFNPDSNFRLEKNSAILTIGTLEQLGEDFKPFINYLLKNKPKVCIHMETLYELYDESNLLDYLAIKYLEQRRYLKGFFSFLKTLEAKKRVEILEARRTFGSFYHEGYTYIVWRPL